MSTSAELLAIAAKRLYPNYKPAAMVLARGRGCELFDVDGRRWLDLCAGVAVCSVGHAHPKLVKAIAEQAARVMHVSNYFYNEENILLADELCAKSGMARAMFCNSGAEANEALFKLARRHAFAKGEKRTKIVAFHNAFHGRTMGALSMTGTPKYREGFGEVAGVVHVAYGDLDAVKAQMGADVAAVIVEPVQGEGGVLPAPAGFLAGLRALCDEHGALLLMDEVQTGIGRLGRWFGFQDTGAMPDAISLAKGLGGGFPDRRDADDGGARRRAPAGNARLDVRRQPARERGGARGARDPRRGGARRAAQGEGRAALGDARRRSRKELPAVCEGERGEGLLRGLVLEAGLRRARHPPEARRRRRAAHGGRRARAPLLAAARRHGRRARGGRRGRAEGALRGRAGLEVVKTPAFLALGLTRRGMRATQLGSMDASRRPPPSSASREALCPGCGKAIDPLRAGQVAILDGSFRYFCGAECKVAFVDVTSKRPSLEALTAEPPAVSAKSTPRPTDRARDASPTSRGR